jgi:hypothetical protein
MPKPTARKPPTLTASALVIRRFANSFKGQSISEARKRLSSGKIKITAWDGNKNFDGKQLVATFPNYEVRIFFYQNAALITSVQILSK